LPDVLQQSDFFGVLAQAGMLRASATMARRRRVVFMVGLVLVVFGNSAVS
jgi:hypothetical protein